MDVKNTINYLKLQIIRKKEKGERSQLWSMIGVEKDLLAIEPQTIHSITFFEQF